MSCIVAASFLASPRELLSAAALSCAFPVVQRADLHLARKKLVQQPVRMCGGRESAAERASKWTSERDRKEILLKPANRHPPCAEEREGKREGDPGLTVPLLIRSCLALATTEGCFSMRAGARDGPDVRARRSSYCEFEGKRTANCFPCLRSCIYR